MTHRTAFFAWTVLALALITLIIAEQDRPWKCLQAEHRDRELDRLRAELEVELERTSGNRSLLESELADARQRFEKNRDAARRLEERLTKARLSLRWASAKLERLRLRSAAGGDVADEELRDARRSLEEHRHAAADLETELGHLRSELDDLEARRARERERLENLREELARLERGAFWRRLPGLRGLDPTLEVVEVSPPGLVEDTPAGPVPRVDRCMTCHPAASHPGDLVGEDAPHRPELFGCTVCHGGNGRATEFSYAGHWPESAAQEAEWAGAWDFRRAALPRRPILPPAFVEAGCVECHPDGWRPVAGRRASVDLGRRLILRMGCTGCHAIDRPEYSDPGDAVAPRPGPPLVRLAAKTTPEWAFHWIAAPRRFRPTTWMPHLFPDDMDGARKGAVVHAMVRYLWSLPGTVQAEAPLDGDAEAGAALFASTGCTGCHLLDAGATRASVPLERLRGPNLARTGDKVRASWLYAWLIDPRSHRPDTPMPSLRLSAGEAADLTAFLMTRRDGAGRDLEMPLIDGVARDELVLEYLEEELSIIDGAARFAEMSREEKELYLGRRTLEAYGCHGCHDIPGFEDPAPVAGPLATIGADPRRLLADDDFLTLAHRPRPGRRTAPDFGMSRRESAAVVVNLLSFKPPAAAPERRAERGDQALALVRGRRLLERHGCLGCHAVGDRGGAISEAIAGDAHRPPTLTSAGARFKPSWLFDYLEDPSRYDRRPWLTVRMPTFDLSPEETSALVRYFAERDGEPLFTAPPPAPAPRDLEVGRAVAAMLQCGSCHAGSPGAEELSPRELAPVYRGARNRLRPDWAVRWILDPEGLIPGTMMPVTFGKDESRSGSSFLTATISAPMFGAERQRLLAHFDSEDEMLAFLADERRVAAAIRDYLWSLGE